MAEIIMPRAPAHACWGLLTQRPRWSLSLRGWLLLLVIALTGGAAVPLTIYPFLALTDRSDANLLAVEGWIHDYAIRSAKNEFDAGRYDYVIATGGPVHGVGPYINDFSTAASIGAHRLKREGIVADRVQMAPARTSERDRTYGSAVALRDWLHARQIPVRALNVITEDVHARRTRLLFQAAFGPEVRIGVIAVPNPDYNSARWWRYSEGVRDVLAETISYIYAKFLFFPPRSLPPEITPSSAS